MRWWVFFFCDLTVWGVGNHTPVNESHAAGERNSQRFTDRYRVKHEGSFFKNFFLLELNDNTELNTPNCSGLSRNTVGYQQRRSAVCERVTERLEIVSGGASLHLISAVRRGLPTLEINWMIYFGVTPAALSPCFSCRLCNTVQRSRSRGGCLTWTAWLRCTVAALV